MVVLVHAGQFRTRLIMQQDTADPVTTAAHQAADGYVAPNWEEVARPWCRVRPLDGKEVLEYAALLAEQPVIIECRHDGRFSAVTPTGWRLTSLDGSVAYDILSGVNVELVNIKWRFVCRTGSMVPT